MPAAPDVARLGLVTALLLGGCGTAAPPPVAPVATGAGSTAPPSPTAPERTGQVKDYAEPDDLSLAEEDYAKLGIPSWNRPWNSSDLAKTAKILAEAAKEDPGQLPRYGSLRSGKIFARMTSDENLDSIRGKRLPLAIRMGFGLQFMQACSSLGKSYATGMLQQKTGGDEAAEIVGLNLRIAVVLSDLVEEFLPDIDPKDPTSAARLSGVTQMKSGMSTLLQSALLRASEPKALKPETLDRMLGYFDQSFPALLKVIPPSVRQETIDRLTELSQQPEYAGHRQTLQPILDKLRKAVEESSDE